MKEICVATALKVDENLPEGKRKIWNALNPNGNDVKPDVQSSITEFDSQVSSISEPDLAMRLADEPSPTRAAALVGKVFPALKGRKAWEVLARSGYPAPIPNARNMRLLFRLGFSGAPKTFHARQNYPAVMQEIARHARTDVGEVDYLFSLMTGAVSHKGIQPVCTTTPRCNVCPVSIHCTFFGYNGAPAAVKKKPSIKEWSEDDRPREKLLAGRTLSNAELLAIILRTGSGNQSAVDLARALLEKFETLHRLEAATADEISTKVKGIGKAKAAEIKAAIELGRRIVSTDSDERDQLPQINDSRDVFEMFRARYKTATQEEFIVLSLNTKNRILRESVISRGTLNASIVHPREVFHSALREAAAAVIFVHNHPSGDCAPSAEDRALTVRLSEAGKILGIRVLDHVIIGARQHYSFADGRRTALSSAPPQVLVLNNLTKHFGKHVAVNNVSFEVNQGDIFGFLGPNGAGKSTTLYMVSGLVHPTSGDIRIFGRPHTDFTATRAGMGVLIETPAFYEYLSGYKNLEVLGRLQGVTDRKRIDNVLDLVGLLDRARDRVGNYSHGMKQRLGIAQALLNRPRLLVLDEPTNGLDPEGSAQIWELLRRVAAEERTSILISSHLLHEVEEGCNRIAVINQGIIVACDHVRNLLFFSKEDLLFLFPSRETSAAAVLVIGQREGTEVIAAPEGAAKVEDDTAVYVRLQQGLAQDVISELVARNLTPTAVIPQKKTLKQFFLELTRRQPAGKAGLGPIAGSEKILG